MPSQEAIVPCGEKVKPGTKASLATMSWSSTIFTLRAALSRLVLLFKPCSMSDCSCGSVNTVRQARLPKLVVSLTASVSVLLCTSRTSPVVFTSGRSYLLYIPQLVISNAPAARSIIFFMFICLILKSFQSDPAAHLPRTGWCTGESRCLHQLCRSRTR